MSKIVTLKTENIKRLKAIRIDPEGKPVVVIAGRNEQGKSSVLDSIEYALAGKGSLPKRPIRDGQTSAKVELTLDDLIVTRTITAGGGSLKVTSREGTKHDSPQKVLDALVGKLTFDPLAFTHMDPSKQLATLKQLAGLDFDKMDESRAGVYDQRARINRNIKSMQHGIDRAPDYSEVPDQEIDINGLLEQQEKIAKQLRVAQDVNREVQAKRAHIERVETLTTFENSAGNLTRTLKELDQSKAGQIAKAKFPVDGPGHESQAEGSVDSQRQRPRRGQPGPGSQDGHRGRGPGLA